MVNLLTFSRQAGFLNTWYKIAERLIDVVSDPAPMFVRQTDIMVPCPIFPGSFSCMLHSLVRKSPRPASPTPPLFVSRIFSCNCCAENCVM
jgi:hypothetical protein